MYMCYDSNNNNNTNESVAKAPQNPAQAWQKQYFYTLIVQVLLHIARGYAPRLTRFLVTVTLPSALRPNHSNNGTYTNLAKSTLA